MDIRMIRFDVNGDGRGKLVALEERKEIPFRLQRVYYIYDTREGVRRGFHAHKELEQVLVCVSGSCKILLDDGVERSVVELKSPDEGLYIAHDVWREMFDFSSDAVLVVLASMSYDESDYIRDYDEFLDYIHGGEVAR